MATRRGNATTDRRVTWEGDVIAGNLGWAWKDVTCARGGKTEAPATRPVRLDLSDDRIDLACFSADMLLFTTIAATNVTASDAGQVAVADPYHALQDLLKGMQKDGGIAHVVLEAGTQGEAQEMWLADQIVVTWGKHVVQLPVLGNIAEADWQSIPALIALRGNRRVRTARIVDTPGVNRRLASLGKNVEKTYNGDDLPWSIEAEGVKGALLSTVFDVQPPDDTEEAKIITKRAYAFLDSLRKAAPPPDEGEVLPEGPMPIPGDTSMLEGDGTGQVLPEYDPDNPGPHEAPAPEWDDTDGTLD